MKLCRRLVLATALLAVWTGGLRATEIKIGSIAPEGSPWHDTLNAIARAWAKITDGTVTLKIYPGGIAGSETDMLRKMRFGTLDGAVLTNMGMTQVNPNLFVLTPRSSCPRRPSSITFSSGWSPTSSGRSRRRA